MQKHTEAETISQGLKQYLRTCSNSGLPAVRAKGEALAALPKAERMAAYKADFGSNWTKRNAASSPAVPKGGNMDVLTPEVVEALRALGIAIPEGSAEANEGRSFVKGTRFSFTAQNGNVREHTVIRVSKGRAYTDQGQDFSIDTALNGYAADRVILL